VALRRLALAFLAVNVGIVVTGGAVRLTGSGLGCPTWPRCTAGSYVTTPAMGVHGVIEFGNRILTFVLVGVAVLTLLCALVQRDRRRVLIGWAALGFASIPAQAVLGGITVLTRLNPWWVASHFLLSMAVIAVAYTLWGATRQPPTTSRPAAPPPVRRLALCVAVAAVAALAVGTVVTGTGPHAGDANARRTGLDPAAVAQLHADVVLLLLGLSIGLLFAERAAGRPGRAAAILVGVELGQGVVGAVQYLTRLPVLAVLLHMAGACAVWLAVLAAVADARRHPRPAGQPVTATDGLTAAVPRDRVPVTR
jgi:cytochrome c oxidase assembly protein subunit 15